MYPPCLSLCLLKKKFRAIQWNKTKIDNNNNNNNDNENTAISQSISFQKKKKKKKKKKWFKNRIPKYLPIK